MLPGLRHVSKTQSADEEMRRLRKATERSDTMTAVLAALSVTLGVIQVIYTQNDITFNRKLVDKIPLDTSPNPLRLVLHLLSLALGTGSLVLCVLQRYHCQDLLHVLQNRPFQNWRRKLCLELLVCSISSPAWLDTSAQFSAPSGDFEYSLDDLCTVLVVLRVYLVLRLLPGLVLWTKPSSQKICSRFEVEPGLMFAMKCELKHRPHYLIAVLLLSVTLLFGLVIRALERGYLGSGCVDDLSQLTNTMWLVIITMTTVGYGDAYPSTPAGRTVVAIAAILGMTLTSLVVVALTNLSTFDPAQQKAYFAIKHHRALLRRQHSSAVIIRRAFELQASLRPFRLSKSIQAAYALKRAVRTGERTSSGDGLDKAELLWQLEALVEEKRK